MTEATQQLIHEMACVVARESDPEAIILFGSHATGSAGPDSDVDILVVKSRPFGPDDDRRQEMIRLWRALARFPVPKDILVFSRQEVERWKDSRNHVIARALREGIVVYGRL
ncbi:MAG: nucleotidyltransferase domain-containing protein [Clostridia bacterium]|nr:nucleotidyltransferase domain-containing protein [Clostridia bacterium]